MVEDTMTKLQCEFKDAQSRALIARNLYLTKRVYLAQALKALKIAKTEFNKSYKNWFEARRMQEKKLRKWRGYASVCRSLVKREPRRGLEMIENE